MTGQARALISVIIPAFNAERYLAEAIDSVMSQTYRPVDIIIVDDGSTDGTRAVAERYEASVRYVFQTNAGIGAARNRGIEMARGELLAFLDADDLWASDKLEWQAEALRKDPGLDMIFGYTQQFPTPEMADEIQNRIRYVAEPTGAYLGPAMLIRRDSFLRVGLFDPQWKVGDFVDWYLRAIDLGLRSAMEPRIVLHRRLHDTNHGTRHRHATGDYARIVRAALDRRLKAKGT